MPQVPGQYEQDVRELANKADIMRRESQESSKQSMAVSVLVLLGVGAYALSRRKRR